MQKTQTNCLHQYNAEHDVHSLILQNTSTAAIDDAVHYFKKIVDEHQTSETIRLLIDARSGIPSLSYFVRVISCFYHQPDKIPPLRVAYLYGQNLIPAAIRPALQKCNPTVQRRAICNDNEGEAFTWLISSEQD